MKITILTDSTSSWYIPFGNQLCKELLSLGHNVIYVHNSDHIEKGDICFLLSCVKLVNTEVLSRNVNNIVVHASDLPKGKGFSPLQWQILDGANSICLTLFEVVEKVDAGPYYFKKELVFDGTELYDELRSKLAVEINKCCVDFVINYADYKPIKQSGNETMYNKRTIHDDELDVDKTIRQLFNHFRIADNEKFPVYFIINNTKYTLKVFKESKS